MTSAYPIPVDELADRVREHARTLGGWPSRNQVMKEFRVGGPKAAAALDALRAVGFDPTTSGQSTERPAERPALPLRAVPDVAEQSPAVDGADQGEVSAREAVPDLLADPDGLDRGAGAHADHGEGRSAQVATLADPGTETGRVSRWPLLLIAGAAFVAIWGGWVGLGELTGFGPIRLLPGIWDEFVINSAITLPIGMEAYAAYALRAWLAPPEAGLSRTARRFAGVSAIGALVLGGLAQVAYHLMVAAGMTHAPWQITAAVSCLPVLVLALAAALTHLIHHSEVAR
ncbi:ABC transporter permease [Pseudonocardia sp. DSM 110487]|uniref:ABC transporter permease n=1 Tax=Pseudonocardia sp. DSM 110487 TaxID=2865833 RepID=UPI001C69ADE9|nr:ABC transporter permease [Pseudonocardia sp. DSM 110487]QYN35187.1 ABC transporter permease [Pseudonocardia sp. DSM 110487]